MQQPIYLDYAATTPIDHRVIDAMTACLRENWANPASRTHRLGWLAEEAVENARNQIADLVNVDSREIVFTSGATESNNLAIKGYLESHCAKRKCELSECHVISSSIEHKAVIDTLTYLEGKGLQVTWLKPDEKGLIYLNDLKAEIKENTVLVSLMWVNNEIGVLNQIAEFGQFLRKNNIIFHVDAAQAVGKLPIDLQNVEVDLLSMSAHKFYGPKGIGALYVRRCPEVNVQAQIHGGGHERGMRSGTLATHQIVGMGVAAELCSTLVEEESKRILELRKRLLNGLQNLAHFQVNGDLEQRVAGILNLSFAGVDGETLLTSLRDLAVSSGSACTSVTVEPSYVLKALGLSDELAHSALRISFGRFTTEEEIDFAIESITQTVSGLRAAS